MDKLTRTVTIMVAIIIAVSAVLLAFFLTRSNEQKVESSSSVDTDEKATLVSPSIEHVQSMKITNQYGTYTIVPFGDVHGDADTYYTIEGMDINQLDVYAIQNIVKYGCNPVSTNNIGNVENLSEYGLDNPIATISIMYEDGEIYDYYIGNAVNGKNNKYYMCAKDSSNVYVIMIESGMLGSRDDLLNKTIFSISQYDYVNKNDYNAAENGFSSISIMNPNLTKELVYEKVSGKTYSLSDYQTIKPNDTTLDQMKTCLESLKADEVITASANQEQLEQYGLKEPDSHISFVVNQQSYQLLIGNKTDDNMYYVKKADSDVIYKINSDKISVFTDATLFSLTNPRIYATDETDFSDFEIDYKNHISHISLEREEDEYKSTENKTYYQYYPVLNGTQMDSQQYESFLSAIQNTVLEQATNLTAEGEPALKITVKHFDTDRIDTISFYETDGNILVVTEDMIRGTIGIASFDSLIGSMPI
ncbi:MAG: DUF4340 domain-containing protein [Acutalibacteraceae bacterium]|nr:DUF4340 domain-containing protein [Acutalibacteraceae bacterium]